MLLGFIVLASGTAQADYNYTKLGFTSTDVETYKHLSIPSCATVREENPDAFKPVGGAEAIRHFAHLYAQCQADLEARHATIAVLRVNDVFLGVTCIALGVADPDGPVDDSCNVKSYLPTGHQ